MRENDPLIPFQRLEKANYPAQQPTAEVREQVARMQREHPEHADSPAWLHFLLKSEGVEVPIEQVVGAVAGM